MNICFVLDGILIFYAITLTILYCRLRMHPAYNPPATKPEKPPIDGCIYMGLTPHSIDTYDTISIKKQPLI